MIADPALVVIDMQNDFCSDWNEDTREWELRPEFEATVKATQEFIERYRESGRTPIFVGAEHNEHTVSEEWDERYDRPRGMSCYSGSEGAEFVSELNVRDSDIVVRKRRYNAFYKTDLDLYLSTNDVRNVLFAGVATNVCVLSSLLGAYNRDYKSILLSDCSGSKSSESHLHEMTLENVRDHFGSVKESTEIELDPVKDKAAEPTD